MNYYTIIADMKKKVPLFGLIIGALVSAFVIKLVFLDFFIIEGESMVPAIQPGKMLFVCKTWYGIKLPGTRTYLLRWAEVKQGDIVVFYTPSGEKAVKRCKQINGDEFLAAGDNSRLSQDSRSYGPVSVNNIIGKVLGVK